MATKAKTLSYTENGKNARGSFLKLLRGLKENQTLVAYNMEQPKIAAYICVEHKKAKSRFESHAETIKGKDAVRVVRVK